MATKCLEKVGAMQYTDASMSGTTFWTLSILVFINAKWVSEQFDLYMDLQRRAKLNSTQSPEATELLAQPAKNKYFWLQPHITSRERKFWACIACAVALGVQSLQILEAYKGAWRLSVSTFIFTWRKEGWIALMVFFLVLSAIIFAWICLLTTGLAWTFTQISYLFQLYSLPTDNPTDLTLRVAGPPPVHEYDSEKTESTDAAESEKLLG